MYFFILNVDFKIILGVTQGNKTEKVENLFGSKNHEKN